MMSDDGEILWGECSVRRRAVAFAGVALVSLGLAVIAGCSFDSTVGGRSCEAEERPGAEAVCGDGRRVAPDGARADGGDAAADGSSADTGPRPTLDAGDGGEDGRATDAGADAASCTPGATRSCYSAAPETEGVGRCVAGEQTCQEDGSWGSCEGEKKPNEETCDDVDNDCDGDVDEADGCACQVDSTSVGVCSEGQRGGEGNCQPPETWESTESSCEDQLDNDCDGETDGEDGDCGEEEDDEQRPPGQSCEEDEDCRSQCVDETCAHRVFVTSRTYNGDFGGLGGADQICNSRATHAGASGTFKAILSDSVSAARDRLDIRGPVVRWDGRKVADGASDLWDGSIDTPIEISEEGSIQRGRVWTGTNQDGSRDGSGRFESGQYCEDWNALRSCAVRCGEADGEAGDSAETDRRWIVGRNDPGCRSQIHLYCIDGQ